MDALQRLWYRLQLRLLFHERRGDAFQDFFAELMARKHRGDFLRSRPWGNEGDRKNDGYLRSTRTMFQVYAPDEFTAAKTVAKIREDFPGALEHWDEHLDEWVFVHNGRGLGPQVTKALLDEFAALRKKHPSRRVATWGYEEIEPIVMSLSDDDLAELLGRVGSLEELRRIGYAEIQPVLSRLAEFSPAGVGIVRREVPEKKLEFNGLSEHAQDMIRMGMRRVDAVERYLRESRQPTLGDKVAAAYNTHYLSLRLTGKSADEIFEALLEFTNGPVRRNVGQELAALTVLAHFFASCDIFEDAPPSTGPDPEPTLPPSRT